MNIRSDNPTASRPRRGFTMVELMAAIVIVSILAALTISVSVYLRQDSARKVTVATLDILSTAIEAYREEKGSVPAENSPTNPTGNELAQATARSKNLYTQLFQVKSSADRLANLPKEANGENRKNPASMFYDGFGNPIDYQSFGGLGGAPLLRSAGPDGKFGFSVAEFPTYAEQVKFQKDNIQK